MSTSANLGLTHLSENQAQAYVLVNEAIEALDSGVGYLSKSVAGGAGTTTLTAAEAMYGVLELTGALTGNRTVRVPAGLSNALVVINNTTGAYTVDLDYNGGTAVRIPRGCAVPVRKNAGVAAYDYRAGMVKLPEAIVYRDSSGQTMTLNAETVVQFNAESRDTAEAFDSTTNYRFDAPAAGLYMVNAMVEIDVSAGILSGSYRGVVSIRVNGTVVRRGEVNSQGVSASTTQRHGCQALLQLAQGDYVDVVYGNAITSGVTLTADFGIEKTYLEIACLRLGT